MLFERKLKFVFVIFEQNIILSASEIPVLLHKNKQRSCEHFILTQTELV